MNRTRDSRLDDTSPVDMWGGGGAGGEGAGFFGGSIKENSKGE